MAAWETQKAHLKEAANFLMEFSDPQTSRVLEEELRGLDQRWTDFVSTNTFVSQRLCREAGVAGAGQGRHGNWNVSF